MEFRTVKIEGIPEDGNIILGQTHFIKTVEDLYEAMVTSHPSIKFGIAFCEASAECLVRVEGNDEKLKDVASQNALRIGAGHTFIIVMKEGFPINVLNAVKNISEVCSIYCATANPVEVVVAETEQGRGIMGVIDGLSPKGIEGKEGIEWRKSLLRKIGYKK